MLQVFAGARMIRQRRKQQTEHRKQQTQLKDIQLPQIQVLMLLRIAFPGVMP